MYRKGREVRSRTDYLQRKDCHMFYKISDWDSQHNSNHYMVSGFLRGAYQW